MPDNTYYIEFSSNTPIDEKPRILGGELIIPRYFSGLITIRSNS